MYAQIWERGVLSSICRRCIEIFHFILKNPVGIHLLWDLSGLSLLFYRVQCSVSPDGRLTQTRHLFKLWFCDSYSFFFPISMRRSEQFILQETSYPSAKWFAKVFGSVSALLLTTASWYKTAWPSWIRHYCHPEQSYQYPNPIPTFYHQQPFRTNMEHFT